MENNSPQVIIQQPPTTPTKPRFKFSKRTLAIIFVAIIAIVVPLTISLVSHQQDNRQRASAADCQQLTLTFAQMKATGVCNYQGSTQCTFIQKQITQTCSGVAVLTPKPTSSSVSQSSQGNNIICAEVITYGRNTTTHACQQFPTSCIPSGWTSDPACNPTATTTPIGTASATPTPTCTPYPSGCVVNGRNICAFFAAPRGGWCPIGSPTPFACPADARLCPDGSSIGRTGPNCSFPACPGSNTATPSATPTVTVSTTPPVSTICGAWANYYTTLMNTHICNNNQILCNQVKTQMQTASCPIPSVSPIANASTTPSTACALKSKGDADCDGKVNILDFNIWRDKYLLGSNPTATPPPSFLVADFNGDGGVSILDFNIWRDGFLSTTVPH